MKRRSQELLNDYPEIVSKLLLLHESGLTIQNAFSVILKDYKSKNTAVSMHYAYLEIERTINKIQSGFPNPVHMPNSGSDVIFMYISNWELYLNRI